MAHKLLLIGLLLALTQLLAASSAVANEDVQDTAGDTLEHRVQLLEDAIREQTEELDVLKSSQDGTSSPAGWGSEKARYFPSRGWLANYGIDSIEVSIHGFLNLEYIDAGSDGARGGVSTFDLHHANIFFDATVNKTLRTHLEVEFEHASETIEIDQAFFEWTLDDALILTAGRFYAPFGIERFAWFPPANMLVSRPLAFREIIPGNFYQQGLMVSGTLECACLEDFFVTYEVSVSNGLGAEAATDRRGSRQKRDNNSDKAVTARIAGIFFPWIEIGASVYNGEYQDGGGNDEVLFLGADLAARWMGFEVRSEYVWASLDRSAMNALRQQGWYVELAYTQLISHRWIESVTLVGRVDGVDLDRGASGGVDRRRWSIGSNVRIFDHFVVKAEYQFATEDGPSQDDDAFLAAFVVDF